MNNEDLLDRVPWLTASKENSGLPLGPSAVPVIPLLGSRRSDGKRAYLCHMQILEQ